MGSDKMIATKTVPIGMNVNFRIPFFSVCVCVCVILYCLPAIKPNTMTKYKRIANDAYLC